jgi:glycerol-3-phosphate dehydrogenase (NAD(P)+)
LSELQTKRKNDYLTISDDIRLSNSLAESVATANIIIVSISAQKFRNLAKELAEFNLKGKIIVLSMKGIEIESGKRLSQVFLENNNGNGDVAVWVGPGHVQDFIQGIPNCMIIGAISNEIAKSVVQAFSSELIRLYYSNDLIGMEIGAAAKNVIGLAAGMLDGLHFSSLKGALMARGAYEIANLVKAMGGEELTVFGLSHLGDYEATLFSKYSHNRQFGENFAQGKQFGKLAEGVFTVKALLFLSQKHNVVLPICEAVHDIITKHSDAKESLFRLFLRPLKQEF